MLPLDNLTPSSYIDWAGRRGAANHMSEQDDKAQDISRTNLVRTDLHLCNNYRHLLISLANISATDRPATVIYLEDVLPIPADLRVRLATACPQAEFIFTNDADQITAFARLPTALPAILRRNLSLGGRFGMQRPHTWQPPFLSKKSFATGYLYHAGFFLSKAVAGLCDQVVLRESGLNNYAPIAVPPLKAMLRRLNGLPPHAQIWGEEPWIDAIEVSHPEDLPAAVRGKARRLTFADVMDILPAATAHRIAAAFLGTTPTTIMLHPRTAILLTQPLVEVGICTPAEKQALYENIGQRLSTAGYQIYVKPHPLEAHFHLPGACALPAAFPIEAWPYFSDQKFGLAVALCSASLVSGARTFAHRTTQLLQPHDFNAKTFISWPIQIEAALLKAGLRN